VIEMWEPNSPAFGFCKAPVLAETRGSGAGGKRNGREGGQVMSVINVKRKRGVKESKNHAVKYAFPYQIQ